MVTTRRRRRPPFLLLLALCAPLMAASPGGGPAPSLRFEDLDGRLVTLESMRGHPVLLHFWATWCPHCRNEMPLLEEASREHQGKLIVLGVNLAEKRRKVAAYAAEAGLTFPILLDPRGKAAAACGVLALPTTLIVDPEGRFAGQIPMGSMTREGLQEKLKPFL